MLDFGKLSVVGNYFNTDAIDIGRSELVLNPESGFEEPTDPKIPIYTDIPCHIEYKTQDNATSSASEQNPVLQSYIVHCDAMTDIKNGDYITLKKLDALGNLIATYQGIAGEPQEYQGRIDVNVAIFTWS